MIKDFRDKETEQLFYRKTSRKFPTHIQRTAMRKLWMIDAAHTLSDLLIPPENKLEALTDSRKGQHSIRINKQWRICFSWRSGDAHGVEIIDYH